MSAEQKEILNMLSEKIISTDEAERLLNALGSKARDRHRSGRHGFTKKTVHQAANSVNETFSNIGPMVKEMIADISSSFRSGEVVSLSQHDDEYEPISFENDAFEIDPGATLHIINKKGGRKNRGSNLTILSTDDDKCGIKAEAPNDLRILQSPAGPLILWDSGQITVYAPTGLGGVNASTRGGDIEVERLDCWLNVKTMGGDIDLIDLKNGFNAKTMGGNISLAIEPSWGINSRVKTMGGDITVSLPDSVNSAEIIAATMGGEINVENSMDNIEQSIHGVNKRVRLQIGDAAEKPYLNAKTMGGDIHIKRIANG